MSQMRGIKKDAIVKIREYFSEKPAVVAVYLYGSQAKNLAGKDSDIDLGVVLGKGYKTEAFSQPQFVFSQALSQILGRKVEVQDLRACRIDFSHRVLSEGILIYVGNEKERIKFETEILRNYFDLKPSFDEYYKNLSEIAKKGELNVRYI